MTGQRGATLVATLAIGFAVLVLVGQSLITIGRLSSAATAAEESARYAATWAARYGDASDARQIAQNMVPDATVEVTSASNRIAVVVEVEVSLIGPEGSLLTRTVTGRADVPVSEFRSLP